ncbi:hypothetical protein V8C35DRAFT_331126 [Trichoderma chlorosporum]
MMLLRVLVSIFFHLPMVLSLPQVLTHPHHHNRSVDIDPPSPTIHPIPMPLPPTTSTSTPTTPSDPWTDMCKPGAECDCSRIQDKNGEEYFQCVTNPRCDHCWMNFTTTTTTTPSSPSTAPVTNLFSTDFRTLLPGTYTSSAAGTAHVVVVQPSQHTTTRYFTLTKTRFVTVSVTPVCDVFSTR